MSDVKLHRTSVIKRGTSERIFLAFAGRRHRASDEERIPAKSDMKQEFIGILLLFGAACMIAVAVWHFFAKNY